MNSLCDRSPGAVCGTDWRTSAPGRPVCIGDANGVKWEVLLVGGE